MKKLLLTMTLLLATVGAWAQETTPVVADGVYTIENVYNQRGAMCYGQKNGTEYFALTGITLGNYGTNSVTVAEEDIAKKYWYVKTTERATYIYNIGKGVFLQARSGATATCAEAPGELALVSQTVNGTDYVNIKSSTYYMSFSCGWTPAQGQFRWQGSVDNGGSQLTFAAVDNASTTYATQIADADAKIKAHEPDLVVTINVKNEDDTEVQYTQTVKVNPGETIRLSDYLPSFSFVSYDEIRETVTETNNTFIQTYTVDTEAENAFPFVTSYSELDEQKWVSFFTMYGRMFVCDENCVSNGVTKYPAIDKATFTSLDNKHFWGFVRETRFSPLYIVNKGAGEGKYLYLTQNGNNVPVRMGTEQEASSNKWFTREWIVGIGQTSGGEQYYTIEASGAGKYINNYRSTGFMVTWEDGSSDVGSNIKFTSEIETYNTLKERALSAPKGAVHSLNDVAREKIINNTDNTVSGYRTIIDDINDDDTNAGFIRFQEGGYYYLRNYTPAGEGKKTFVLGSEDGTTARTFEVLAGVGDANSDMDYSNINAIWKISENEGAPKYPTGSDHVGVSKTIGRYVTHANSGNRLTSDGTAATTSFPLNSTGTTLYFVNLGAGQHFIKNAQYNGSGQQAQAMPIKCDDNGNLARANNGLQHFKNSRDTWYGIPVSDIKVAIGAAGYASLHLPFGVDLPAGEDLEAYAVTGVTAATATLTGVTSVPANQGVILKGTAGKTYSLAINDAAAWEIEGNLLRGSNMHENVTDAAYVLSMPSGATVAGFYKAAMAGGSWLNNDNKAYLPASAIPADAPSLSFVFDTETGIEGIGAAKAGKSAIYDLSGRRVKSAQKGIYIINGKKVVK